MVHRYNHMIAFDDAPFEHVYRGDVLARISHRAAPESGAHD
jgi:hypothetical protein